MTPILILSFTLVVLRTASGSQGQVPPGTEEVQLLINTANTLLTDAVACIDQPFIDQNETFINGVSACVTNALNQLESDLGIRFKLFGDPSRAISVWESACLRENARNFSSFCRFATDIYSCSLTQFGEVQHGSNQCDNLTHQIPRQANVVLENLNCFNNRTTSIMLPQPPTTMTSLSPGNVTTTSTPSGNVTATSVPSGNVTTTGPFGNVTKKTTPPPPSATPTPTSVPTGTTVVNIQLPIDNIEYTADLEDSSTDLTEVLLPELLALYPGASFTVTFTFSPGSIAVEAEVNDPIPPVVKGIREKSQVAPGSVSLKRPTDNWTIPNETIIMAIFVGVGTSLSSLIVILLAWGLWLLIKRPAVVQVARQPKLTPFHQMLGRPAERHQYLPRSARVYNYYNGSTAAVSSRRTYLSPKQSAASNKQPTT